MSKVDGRKKEGRRMDRREGEGKIFCTFSSLEAFNEDRLTRSLTKELVAEREKVILIIIIAVCVQSLWLCVFFLRDLVAELSIQYSFWCLSSVVRFVLYLGKILTEVIDENADDSKSRLIYFIIGFRLGWKKGLINRSLHSLSVFAFLHSRFVTASIDEYRKNLLFVW